MKTGFLSEHFVGVVAKRLSAVEADSDRSNQHEFNGTSAIKEMLGKERHVFPTHFIYLADDEDDMTTADANLTWYDARENHPTRSEYRLYFPSTSVSEKAIENDLLVIALRQDGTMLIIIAKQGSTAEYQLNWLFGLAMHPGAGFVARRIDEKNDVDLGFAGRLILEYLGIEADKPDENWLEKILQAFPDGFPTTRQFSRFARDSIKISSLDDPDAALVAWTEHEEILFLTLERHIVAKRLEHGFGSDVDEFIRFSLSVQNRRKSRAGLSMENHLEKIFQDHGIRFSRGQITEHPSRPDFIFPGIENYRDSSFPGARLTMLGVKTSCKDRWRQIISEAKRIHEKHLFTIEPGISENQTSEMQSHHVMLVLPTELHATYTKNQQKHLLNLDSFISLVQGRQ